MVYPRHHPHGSPPGVASLPAGASACPRPPFFPHACARWCPCILTSGTLLNDICHPLTYIISRVRFPCVRCPLAILVCSSSKFHDRGPSSITVSPFCTSAPAPNEQLTSARPPCFYVIAPTLPSLAPGPPPTRPLLTPRAIHRRERFLSLILFTCTIARGFPLLRFGHKLSFSISNDLFFRSNNFRQPHG